MTEAGPRNRQMAVAGLVLSTGWGLLLTVLVMRGEPSLGERWSEWLPMALLFLSQATLPAVGRLRPGALLAAGILGLPLCLVSFAGLGFPYIVPSILFFSAAARGGAAGRHAVIGLAAAAVLVASFLVAVTNTTEVCWATRIEGGCSEVPTQWAAIGSIALTLATVGTSGVLGRSSLERRTA